MKLQWPEGLSSKIFLRDYWQQKPLLMQQAFAHFDNPLSPDELGGLALEEGINARLILRESATQWHLRHGPFSEEELTSLPAENWSLLVSDIEKHLDGFHDYLQPFRFIADWQIDDLMISYAPTGASVGAHIDQYDVFLFQAAGRREWSIDARSGRSHETLPDLDIKVLKSFEADQQWVLSPGDMLYLPPGVPHHGVSLDNDCMTWSIGFRAPGHAELLTDIAEALAAELPDDARFHDAAANQQGHPAEISSATVESLHSLWTQATSINTHTFSRYVGRSLTQRNPQFELDDSQQHDSPDTALAQSNYVRDSASRLAYIKHGSDLVALYVDGSVHEVTEALAQRLCDGFAYSADELAEHLELPPNRDCFITLWRQGILTTE